MRVFTGIYLVKPNFRTQTKLRVFKAYSAMLPFLLICVSVNMPNKHYLNVLFLLPGIFFFQIIRMTGFLTSFTLLFLALDTINWMPTRLPVQN